MEYLRSLQYKLPLLRGEDVRSVQQALLGLHVQPPCGPADGVYGPGTAATVKAFQHTYNVAGRGAAITENGVVAEDTWNALFSSAGDKQVSAARVKAAAGALDGSAGAAVTPPLNPAQVKQARAWMATSFGGAVDAAAQTVGGGVDANLIYAIACQETACVWLGWIEKLTPQQVLARCVFDPSGDTPPFDRRAFPTNTQEFRTHFGDPLTTQLISEANATRQLRGYKPRDWVYKGYGLFQYDLQNIQTDADFFTGFKWGDIQTCLDRFGRELRGKLTRTNGDLRAAVRAYNGAGPAADRYVANVMQMREWCVS
jgi:peptidoglycan hydrolase-like protein with peptidoglycan-binding domain